MSPGSKFFRRKPLPLVMRNGSTYFWIRSRISRLAMAQLPFVKAQSNSNVASPRAPVAAYRACRCPPLAGDEQFCGIQASMSVALWICPLPVARTRAPTAFGVPLILFLVAAGSVSPPPASRAPGRIANTRSARPAADHRRSMRSTRSIASAKARVPLRGGPTIATRARLMKIAEARIKKPAGEFGNTAG